LQGRKPVGLHPRPDPSGKLVLGHLGNEPACDPLTTSLTLFVLFTCWLFPGQSSGDPDEVLDGAALI